MKFVSPLLFLASLFLVACGDKPAPPPPAKAPVAPKVQKVTTGNVALIGLGDRVEPVIEVITVGHVPNKVYEMITRQHTALDGVLNPKSADTGTSQIMSPQDHQRITRGIEAVEKDYPERVTVELFGDTAMLGETKTYVTRESLHQRYKKMLESIEIENLVEGLNAATAQMKQDYELLQKHAKVADENGRQAKADINFLADLSKHMQEYQNVVAHYDEARRKELIRQQQEQHALAQMASPEETWKRTQAEVSPEIELELYKTATGTGYAEEDGSFQANGHGKVIVRGMMDGYSVFFVHEGPGGDFIDITNLRSQILETEKVGTTTP